ncbi:MAG: peptidoglycan DD-metalloendopeptidase family protein [Candidatus Dormibacteria bacterium]
MGVPGVIAAAPSPALPGGAVALPGPTPAPPSGAVQSAAPAGSPPPSNAAGSPATDSLLAQLAFSDPFLGAQVSAIVANPVAPQPPDLRHLAFVTSGPGDSGVVPAGAAATATGPGRTGVALALAGSAVLLVLILAGGLLLAPASRLPVAGRIRAALRQAIGANRMQRLVRPGLRPRLVAAAAVPAIALVAGVWGVHHLTAAGSSRLTGAPKRVTVPAGTVAALQIRSGTVTPSTGTGPPPAAAAAGGPPAGVAPAPRATTVAPAPPAVLLELRGVEEQIAAAHGRLAAAEARVGVLAAAPLSVRNPTGQTRSLQAAVAERTAALTASNTALAAEYAFYRAVAGDSARSTALVAAVQALGRPDLIDGVVYNLQVVRTQLAEERALAALAVGPPDTGTALAALPGGATLHLPFNGVFTQPFGPTSFGLEAPIVYRGVFYPHFHTGLDLAAPLDTPVGAGAAGVVVFAGQSVNSAGQLVGYGNYVVVAHAGGYQTLYGHLDRILVRAGQPVVAGEVLGLEGSTGWSTGAHTHFELRHLGEPVDPMPFLTGQPLS